MARPRRDDETILTVARMRYDQRLSQQEIARTLAISESTVSRTLKAALDLGFVEIQVAPRGWRDSALERRLAGRFGLALAVVVQPRDSGNATLQLIGRAVAGAIEARVRPGDVIGVSDGKSTAVVAASIRRAATSDVDVVSLIGGVGAPQIETHSAEVCRTLAAGLGARAWQLAVPAVVDDAASAQALMTSAGMRAVFDLIGRLSIAVVGVGAITADSTVFRHGVIDTSYLQRIAARGAVGSICARFYGADGRPVDSGFDDRTLSASLSDIAKAPLRLAVAQGGQKTAAIAAALRGGLVNALATDAPTAEALLREEA
jgi:DNA-binding transcriptional regulator LsrR (DeoR family)